MTPHYLLTKLIIQLGPTNPLVRFLIRRKCSQHGVEVTFQREAIHLQKDTRAMWISQRHFVYAPDMSLRFDTYFSPIVAHPVGGISVVDYSKPGLQTYKKSGLQFELASFPEEDDAIEGYFHWYKPKLGDTIYDIGAHCGVSTYCFSKLVGPAGRVIAFEPDPLNHSLLLRNIARHQLQNVVPLRIAIAGSRGRAAFDCEGTIGSGLSRHSSRAAVGNVEMVETITLADSFEEWGVPALCKIDIEGAEIEVITAARELLKTGKSQFAVDTNHLVRSVLTNIQIEKLFTESGYEVKSAKVEGMMTTWARPSTVQPELRINLEHQHGEPLHVPPTDVTLPSPNLRKTP